MVMCLEARDAATGSSSWQYWIYLLARTVLSVSPWKLCLWTYPACPQTAESAVVIPSTGACVVSDGPEDSRDVSGPEEAGPQSLRSPAGADQVRKVEIPSYQEEYFKWQHRWLADIGLPPLDGRNASPGLSVPFRSRFLVSFGFPSPERLVDVSTADTKGCQGVF